MKTCIACSMPLSDPKEIGCEVKDGPVCIHCTQPGGGVKSCEEVFEGGVAFFLSATKSQDRSLAERLVCKNMRGLPHWNNNPCPCLKGAVASDEEFASALAQLS
ncbi:MAG: zinc ribbon domain-containing protein [Candidatus Peribacteraceae bacterium]|nr:zinc ribbon domain-containing protein [Candidatus Peribacteraceae bacterium]